MLRHTITFLKPLFAVTQPTLFAALPGSLTLGHSAKGAWEYRINSPGDFHCARAAPHSCCALEKPACRACWPQHLLCLQSLCFTAHGVALAKLQPRSCAVSLTLPSLPLHRRRATRDGILEENKVGGHCCLPACCSALPVFLLPAFLSAPS